VWPPPIPALRPRRRPTGRPCGRVRATTSTTARKRSSSSASAPSRTAAMHSAPDSGGRAGFEIRPVAEDELPAFVAAGHVAFSEEMTPARLEAIRAIIEIDRTLAAFEAGRVVGTAAAGSWELTVPGPAIVP